MVILTQSSQPHGAGPHWLPAHPDQPLTDSVAYLARALAHDLNNLLTVIRGHCDVLAQAEHPGGIVPQRIGEILLASDQAILLARQLQHGPRSEPAELRTVDLNQVLQEARVLALCLLRGQHELILDLDPQPCPVRIGPGQVERVLANLTVNAREAMLQPGTLRISTRRLPAGAPSGPAAHLSAGGHVCWTVQDTGRGLEEAMRLRLLHPPRTGPTPGRGLGLLIVQALVQEWNGRVEIDSEPGHGAAVRMLLPLADLAVETPVMTAAALTGPAVPDDQATILLVEDENLVRAIFKRMLHDQGYQVIEAANPWEAIDLAKARTQAIDLLVTDLALPRMNGVDLADQVRQVHPETKVLMLSGYRDGVMPGHDGSALRHPFLQKPCTSEIFLTKVREVLAG